MPIPRLAKLLDFITEAFSKSELDTLCFKLDVNPDNLSGDTLEERARELIEYMKRRDRLPELLTMLEGERSEQFRAKFGNLEDLQFLNERPRVDSWVEQKKVQPILLGMGVVALVLVALALLSRVLPNNGIAEAGATPSGNNIDETGAQSAMQSSPTATATLESSLTVRSTRELTATSTATQTTVPTMTVPSTPTSTVTLMPQAGETRIVNRGELEVEQIYVPAGEFIMGSTNANDAQAMEDEMPQRTIYLDAFWIDKTETTNRQYALCRVAGTCPKPTNFSSASRPSYYYEVNLAFADYPVVYIDWDAANAYCQWANARLPTEAEWEKAARGTDGRRFPWGNEPVRCDLANVNLCVGDTTDVGRYPSGASPYGALDMIGNVWEWVQDNYQRNYYSIGPARNPLGPESGSNRVLRGGAWTHGTDKARAAYRLNDYPRNDYYNYGIRCVSD